MRTFAVLAALAAALLVAGSVSAPAGATTACPLETGGAAGYAAAGGISCVKAQWVFDHLKGGRRASSAPGGWRCVSFLIANEHSEVDCVGPTWRMWARYTIL